MAAQLTTAFGWAWLAATLALAIHVFDEATHDFLSWYNPRALRIRRALGGLRFPPTFTFVPWVVGLSGAVLVLAVLTPAAYAREPWLRPVAYLLSLAHVGNGMLHLVATVLAKRAVPGVLSAPLLVVAGIWLGYAAAHLP